MTSNSNIKEALNNVARTFAAQASKAVKEKPILRKSKRLGVFQTPATASGRLANSMEITHYERGVRVTALAYIHYIIYGRKPGKFAPTDKIEEWCKIKGINAPFAVNRSLAINGSTIYQYHHGKNSGLLDDIDISNELKQLEQELTNELTFEIWR